MRPWYGDPAPGEFPFTRGISEEGYRQRLLDHAPVCGVRQRGRVQSPLPVPPGTGSDGTLGRIRPSDADGVRLGRPPGPGRSRKGRRRDRDDRRHAPPDRGDPSRRRLHLDDDQFHGPHPPRPAARRRPRARSRVGTALGDHPERSPQGVHGAGDLHLPSAAVADPDDRHLRVLRPRGPALEHDLDLGVPHPRGRLDRRPGGRLHPVQRDRVRRGGARPGACRSTPSLRGSPSSSTPIRISSKRSPSSGRRGALWARDHPRPLRREGSPILAHAVPRADGRALR